MNKNTTQEYCPYCEGEVELKMEHEVQKCNTCNSYLMPCSICELLKKDMCSRENCPYENDSNIIAQRHNMGVTEKHIKLLEYMRGLNYYEAKAVLKIILEDIQPKDVNKFIEDELCVFREKIDAFNWIFDDEEDGVIDKDNIDLIITEDMVGRNLKDIILESQENYIEVIKDKLYITHWL